MATPNEQAQNTLGQQARLADTQPAVTEGVQLASGGSQAIDFIRGLFEPITEAAKAQEKLRPQRVPTPMLEKGLEYVPTQRRLSKKLLSEEGAKKFEESGFDAKKTIDGEGKDGAVIEEALSGLEESEELVKGARATLRSPDSPTETGAATEIDALDMLAKTTRESQENVENAVTKGVDGIDFNFNRINTSIDVKNLFNYTSELYAKPIEAAKRGIVTRKETLEEAQALLATELDLTRSILKRKPGQLFNAAQMTAARIIMTKSGERLLKMSQDITDASVRGDEIPAVDLLKLRKAMTLHAALIMQAKGAQTELGRAMGAFNINVSADTPALAAEEALAKLEELGGGVFESGKTKAIKMAKALVVAHKNGGSAGVHKYARRSAFEKFQGVFETVYMNGLLSWTTTQFKNLLGTPLFMAMQGIEEISGGIYGAIERTGKRGLAKAGIREYRPEDNEGMYVGQALMRLHGISMALGDAFRVAGKTYRTGTSADALDKLDGLQYRRISAENLDISNNAVGGAVDWIGKKIEIPGRALLAADDFWRTVSQQGEIASLAYQDMMKVRLNGGTMEEATDTYLMRQLDPRSVGKTLDDKARYNTLTTQNKEFDQLSRMIQHIPLFGRMLMPFARVPTNTVFRTAERMPTALLHPKTYADLLGKNGPAARQKKMGQFTTAWGAMYMMHQLSMNGRVTGAYPRDKRQQNMLPAGWQPYSMVFKAEGWPKDEDGHDLPFWDKRTGAPNGPVFYVSYAGVEPVGALLAISANIAERTRRTNNPEEAKSHAAAAVYSVTDYFAETPFLQSIGKVFQAFQEERPETLFDSPMGSHLVGVHPVGMPLPYSSALRNIGNAMDPRKMKPVERYEYYTKNEVETDPELVDDFGNPDYRLVGTVKGGMKNMMLERLSVMESVQTGRPGMDFIGAGRTEETHAQQYDVLGNPLEGNIRFDINPVIAMNNLFMPFKISKGREMTTVERELIRLQRSNGRSVLSTERTESKKMKFPADFASAWVNTAKNQVLDPARGAKPLLFREALGELIMGETRARKAGGKLDKFYDQMTDKGKIAAIQALENRFYKQALLITLQDPRFADINEAYADVESLKDDDGILHNLQGNLPLEPYRGE